MQNRSQALRALKTQPCFVVWSGKNPKISFRYVNQEESYVGQKNCKNRIQERNPNKICSIASILTDRSQFQETFEHLSRLSKVQENVEAVDASPSKGEEEREGSVTDGNSIEGNIADGNSIEGEIKNRNSIEGIIADENQIEGEIIDKNSIEGEKEEKKNSSLSEEENVYIGERSNTVYQPSEETYSVAGEENNINYVLKEQENQEIEQNKENILEIFQYSSVIKQFNILRNSRKQCLQKSKAQSCVNQNNVYSVFIEEASLNNILTDCADEKDSCVETKIDCHNLLDVLQRATSKIEGLEKSNLQLNDLVQSYKSSEEELKSSILQKEQVIEEQRKEIQKLKEQQERKSETD